MKSVWDNIQDITQISLTVAALCVAPELAIFISIGKIGVSVINRVIKLSSNIRKPIDLPDKLEQENEKVILTSINATKKSVSKEAFKTVNSFFKSYLHKQLDIKTDRNTIQNMIEELASNQEYRYLQPYLLEFGEVFEKHYRKGLIENQLLSSYYARMDIDLLSLKVDGIENRLRSSSKSEIQPTKYDVAFQQLVPFMYRTKYKSRIMSVYNNSSFIPTLVVGDPGIGKTALCKEIYKLKRRGDPNYSMIFVALTGVKSLVAMQLAVTVALDKSSIKAKSFDELTDLILNLRSECFSIYFDNWEDIWNSSNDIMKTTISAWIRNLSYNKIRILISSRVEIPEITLKIIRVGPMTSEESRKIFLKLSGKEIQTEDERKALSSLLLEIEGHTLSIILVAFNAKEQFSLQELLGVWSKCKKSLGNPKHSALDIALRMSWEQISYDPAARLLWGIFFLWTGNFPNIFVDYLPINSIKTTEWYLARNSLHFNSLLHYNIDKKELHMHLAVKNQWPILSDNHEDLEVCVNHILNMLLNIFSNEDVRHKSMNNELSIKLCQCLPSIISFLDENMTVQNESSIRKINTIYNDYFQFLPDLSAEYLKRVLDDNDLIGAMALANCYRRLGNIDEAERVYLSYTDKINTILVDKNDLAKYFFDYAILLIRRSSGWTDYFQAKKLLKKANVIYNEIDRPIGIANSLRREAELEINYKYISRAFELLECAISIYRNEKNALGEANVNYDMGNCYLTLQEWEKAEACFEVTFNLYYSINDPNGYGPPAAKLIICSKMQNKTFNKYLSILKNDLAKVTDTESLQTITEILNSCNIEF